MKSYLLIPILFFTLNILCQTNPEVYLCDLKVEYAGLAIYNMQNISNDVGYDSQPSFLNNNEVLFAANNNGQTDIAIYDISTNKKAWYNDATEGSEYSPQRIPYGEKVSAVRLDTDGLQRLYSYYKGSSNSELLIEGLQVAYYTFKDENTIVASILSGDKLDLTITDLLTKTTDTVFTNSGRSIKNIPNSKSISYTLLNEDKNQDLYIMEDETLESFFVCQLPIGIQDYEWLSSTQILIGSGNKLYVYDTFSSSDWKQIADLSEFNISEITRLAVSPDGTKLALVALPN